MNRLGGAIGGVLLAGMVNGVLTGWLLHNWLNRNHRVTIAA